MTERMSDARFGVIGANCLPVGVDRLVLELYVALEAERWYAAGLQEQATAIPQTIREYRRRAEVAEAMLKEARWMLTSLIAHKVDEVLES